MSEDPNICNRNLREVDKKAVPYDDAYVSACVGGKRVMVWIYLEVDWSAKGLVGKSGS